MAAGSPVKAKNTAKQAMLATHEQRSHKYSGRMELGIVVERDCNNLPPAIQTAILREALINVIKRGKEVDSKVMLNPYTEQSTLPTIKKVEDIPTAGHELKEYISHIQQTGGKIKKGRNNGYRVNLTFTFPAEEFVHLWELTRREYNKVPYVHLRMTPMQDSSKYHTVGFFVNSSEKQCVKNLRIKLEEEAGVKIGIDYRPGSTDRGSQDALWKEAKAKAAGNPREIFKYAPLAQQLYSDTRENAHQAAMTFSAKYGKQIDGQYPRLPDGTRMKFVPAAHYLDMKSKQMSTKLLRQQIGFQSNVVSATIPIKDPYQKFATQDDKTMQELILDMLCEEKDNEPYFRHIAQKWSREYSQREYEVSIHSNMYQYAVPILKNLKEELTKKYGKEVGDALVEKHSHRADEYSQAMSAITLETEDRYMNGTGQFIITGMENVQNPAGFQTTTTEEDERTLQVKSTTSGHTGQTGNTVGSYQAGTSDRGQSETRAPEQHRVNDLTNGSANSTTAATEWTQHGTDADKQRLLEEVAKASQASNGKNRRGQRP